MAAQTFWTPDRLHEMMGILQQCTTVQDAVERARGIYGIPTLNVPHFARVFRDRVGRPATSYLAAKVSPRMGAPEPEPRVTDPSTFHEKLLRLLRQRPHTVEELSDELKLFPGDIRQILQSMSLEGTAVRVEGNTAEALKPPSGRVHRVSCDPAVDVLKLAFISDLHAGSKHARPGELNDFLNIAAAEGCQVIFIAGDLVDGNKVFRGQIYEQRAHSIEDQVDILLTEMLPEVDIPYYFITGNHEASFWRQTGQDIGRAIMRAAQDAGREDFRYLGAEQAMVNFGGVKIELIHPDGGGSYAVSYKLQKLVENYPSGNKPQILCQGHEHHFVYMERRNIHAFKPLCFQAQTPFEMRKRLQPAVGGVIATAHLTEDRSIRRMQVEAVRYYGAEARR